MNLNTVPKFKPVSQISDSDAKDGASLASKINSSLRTIDNRLTALETRVEQMVNLLSQHNEVING